jgi:hypothetical protein
MNDLAGDWVRLYAMGSHIDISAWRKLTLQNVIFVPFPGFP